MSPDFRTINAANCTVGNCLVVFQAPRQKSRLRQPPGSDLTQPPPYINPPIYETSICFSINKSNILSTVAMRGREILKAFLLASVIMAGLTGSQAWGDDLEDAGKLYLTGRYGEAALLSLNAAGQGDTLAQARLGLMYEKGQGVPQDYVLAHMWSNLAAASAEDTQTRYAATEIRDFVAAKMTPAQIAEAQGFARAWRPKAKTGGQ